jgi:predicted flap endonuclease-1-like 5' DNA nuclease
MVQASSPPAAAQTPLSLPVGLMSPLWLAFAGAAATGAAYFWMSRWARPANLEAILPTAAVAPPAAEALEVAPFLEATSEMAPTADAAAEATAAIAEPALDIARIATETVMQSALQQSAAMAEAFDPVDPVVEPLVAAAPKVETAVDRAADDLTRLVGIGPKLAASLAERGVTAFAQIAGWTPDELGEIDQALDLRGRAVRDAWIAQAKRLAEAVSPTA